MPYKQPKNSITDYTDKRMTQRASSGGEGCMSPLNSHNVHVTEPSTKYVEMRWKDGKTWTREVMVTSNVVVHIMVSINKSCSYDKNIPVA